MVKDLAAPWTDAGITHVGGLEARGFAVGAPATVGQPASCPSGRDCCPAARSPPRAPRTTAASGTSCTSRRSSDPATGCCWSTTAERGSQAEAAAELVRQQGAELLGLALVVDELPDAVRARLGRVTSLVARAELGDPG